MAKCNYLNLKVPTTFRPFLSNKLFMFKNDIFGLASKLPGRGFVNYTKPYS